MSQIDYTIKLGLHLHHSGFIYLMLVLLFCLNITKN